LGKLKRCLPESRSQGSLFEPPAGVLADDERGTIHLHAGLRGPLPSPRPGSSSSAESIPWKAERRRCTTAT